MGLLPEAGSRHYSFCPCLVCVDSRTVHNRLDQRNGAQQAKDAWLLMENKAERLASERFAQIGVEG